MAIKGDIGRIEWIVDTGIMLMNADGDLWKKKINIIINVCELNVHRI